MSSPAQQARSRSTLLLSPHAGNFGCARTLRTANEGLVERDKGRTRRSAAQVHRVGEFNSVGRKCKGGCHRRFILGMYIFEAKQLCECVADGTFLKSVQTAQN